MLFNSFNFWFVFPVIFALFWLIPSRFQQAKKWWLIIVSYLLYMNWKPSFALILLAVTAVTFVGGKLVYSRQGADNENGRKKWLCILFALLALLPLLVFKYYNFINEAGTSLLELCGLHFSLPGLNWLIPVGISFFTFQALGYMLDVYYGKIAPERNVTDYILFCSFFPQTASGPISRAGELLPQIKEFRPFDYQQGVEGLKWLLWGMFLKCVVADRLGLYVDTVYANYLHFSGVNCFIASVFFSIQIYGDFAGYSFMALGIAKTLGIDLVNNFRRPYFAATITEFWRRWHISLTRWLTAYVYIPMGGSRCSKLCCYRNIMVTFLVSGLWHGANWTFIVWGALHGMLQILEKALGIQKSESNPTAIKVVRIVLTFLLVNFAWIFFRMPTIDGAWEVVVRIFTDHSAEALLDKASNSDKFFFLTSIVILFAVEFRSEFFRNRLQWLDTRAVRWGFYVMLFAMILSMGVLDAGSFIYVKF